MKPSEMTAEELLDAIGMQESMIAQYQAAKKELLAEAKTRHERRLEEHRRAGNQMTLAESE